MRNTWVERQTDGVNCGPLACYRVLCMFGYEMYLCDSTIKDVEEIRVIVMNTWNNMLKRQSHNIYSLKIGRFYDKTTQVMKAAEEGRKPFENSETTVADELLTTVSKQDMIALENSATKTVAEDSLTTVGTQGTTAPENYPTKTAVEEVLTSVVLEREENTIVSSGAEREVPTPVGNNDTDDHVARRNKAMEKRNARQEQLANKAMKQYAEGVKKLGATSGAYVILKVDFRTHYHAVGLPAVVYKAKETGGILAVCQHGVITSSGDNKDFWVPNDQYKVVALANEDAPMTPDLQ